MSDLWMLAGGPFQDTGRELGLAPALLDYTSEELGELGAEIAAALDHFKMPTTEKKEILDVIVAHKTEVVASLR